MTVHAWPEFLVSAPHRTAVSLDSGDLPRPHGTWHARRAGSLQSACGRSAVTWTYFWTLNLDDGGSSVCPACLEAVRVARRGQ